MQASSEAAATAAVCPVSLPRAPRLLPSRWAPVRRLSQGSHGSRRRCIEGYILTLPAAALLGLAWHKPAQGVAPASRALLRVGMMAEAALSSAVRPSPSQEPAGQLTCEVTLCDVPKCLRGLLHGLIWRPQAAYRSRVLLPQALSLLWREHPHCPPPGWCSGSPVDPRHGLTGLGLGPRGEFELFGARCLRSAF